jgi:polar amino acid transport system substrate-binding protein
MRSAIAKIFRSAVWLGLFAAAIGVVPATGEPVRIAHDQRFPPFAEAKDGRSEGLAVDVLRAAAAKAGVEIVLVPVPFVEVQKTLQDGRAEAIFPLAINPERAKLFDFSAPLVVTGGALFVRAGEPTPDFAALAGKTVTTPRTGPLADYIARRFPDVKLVVTADYDESLKQLVGGQADAAALNFQAGARIAAVLFPGKVTEAKSLFWELPLAVAVPKGKGAEFVAKLNAGLAAVRADGSWQAINNRWMGR